MIGKTFKTPRNLVIEVKGGWGAEWLLEVIYGEGAISAGYQLTTPKVEMNRLITFKHYTEIKWKS